LEIDNPRAIYVTLLNYLIS